MLGAKQIQHYKQHGFLVMPGFKSAASVAALRDRAAAIVEQFDSASTRAIFTTNEQTRATDDYFLTSADKIRCFFEEEAFDASGDLVSDKTLCINKIGHAMHDLDPAFDRFSRDPAVAQVCRDIGIAQPQLWQSMYIFKQPRIGGEVRWHQDATYFYTTPICVTTFWFALQDATRENGCLWLQPGGHLSPLRERFLVTGGEATLRVEDETPWPTQASAIPVEVNSGTLIVFHGLMPHYSAANRSQHSRHAFTLHVADGTAQYARENWLQRSPALPVRGFAHD